MRVTIAVALVIASGFLFIINGVVTRTRSQLKIVSKALLANSQQPQNVVFCDLIKHAATYENKLVRVRASFISNFESSMLYDAGCNEGDIQVELILDCPSDSSCKEMQEILDKGLKGDPFSGMRGDLVMIGRLRRSKVPAGHPRERGASLIFGVSHIEKTIQTTPEKTIPID